MRAKGYKCSNVKCDRCVGNSMCGELGDAAVNCVDRIITMQTNADIIRSMSDEELANFLAYTWATSARAWQKDSGETLRWLKQRAEGE